MILKRLDDAVRDGDRIYAVLRGSAVSQDGHSPGITVPTLHAQAQMLHLAYQDAGIDPARVRYVEAHGTGTPVGDPIEARAIGETFGPGRTAAQPCLIGSIKSNIGHLEAAAGIAGSPSLLTPGAGMVWRRLTAKKGLARQQALADDRTLTVNPPKRGPPCASCP